MEKQFTNALSCAVIKHIGLTGTRQQTLVWLVGLIMRHGTVCLWRLAAQVGTSAQTDSVRRRFYRFFQFVRLDDGVVARMVVGLLGLAGNPWVLAMDRTNWKFGKTSINILMLSVVWNGLGVPLLWTLLPTAGNSKTSARTQLLDRLRRTFPDMKIAALTGDREFIGDGWMRHLTRRKIPFVLRLRENQQVVRAGYEAVSLATLAQNLKRGDTQIVKGQCRLGQAADAKSPLLRLVLLRLKTGELLALACSGNPRRALTSYRQRWTIETLFSNIKTRGFDLEATHLTAPNKLSTLLAVLAIAVTLTVKVGAAVARARPVPLKKHGYQARATFALGLDWLRKLMATPDQSGSTHILRRLCSSETVRLSSNNSSIFPGV